MRKNVTITNVDETISENRTGEKETVDYGFYSNVLKKPFERLEDLRKAEYVYYEEQKIKEDKAAQKKADASKVEDAFKTLNATRRAYKEDMNQLTKEYCEALDTLKKSYNLGQEDLRNKLAKAEENYSAALKEFTEKYPEGYHLTLKDGDFETTISSQTSTTKSAKENELKTDFSSIADLFTIMFNL